MTDENPRGGASEIIFEALHASVAVPVAATAASAGWDLRAFLDDREVTLSDGIAQRIVRTEHAGGEWSITLQPAEMALVPLGFRTRLPHGIEGQVRPRSGQAFKRALTVPNSPGTIDADYAEEWMVIVRNDSPAPSRIVHGERIAQVVFAHVAPVTVQAGTVQRSTERAGGFGSTGQH